MGLVASSKIRKASEAMNRGREYSDSLEEIVRGLSAYEECKRSPYMTKHPKGNIYLAVIAGDRGLAGGYNANVFRIMREYPDAQVFPIGKRACERYGAPSVLAEGFAYSQAKEIADRVCRDFLAGQIDRFGIVCTKYHSLMSQEAYIKWLLPIEHTEKTSGASAIFEPDEVSVLGDVIPEYIAGMIMSAVKESFACEVAARRVAMDSAGKNAQEMIDSLGLEYNRARQSAITQEITEIVAGSGGL